MGKGNEEKLLQKALQSVDKEEADALLSEYFSLTKSLCYFVASAFLHNEEDVADAVMEGYANFFSALFSRGKSVLANPKAYLTKTVKNACLDILRKPDCTDDPSDSLSNKASHGTPSFHSIKADLLGYLSETEVEVIVLSLMGYTEKEIGKAIHRRRGRVSSIYQGALRKLNEHKEDWR